MSEQETKKTKIIFFGDSRRDFTLIWRKFYIEKTTRILCKLAKVFG